MCAGLRTHPRTVSANVHAAVLHQLIIYNHVKGLYCTNSTSMLTEWLCGMDPAEPDRSVISLNHSQDEITTQRDRGPANTSITTQLRWGFFPFFLAGRE